MSDRTWGIQRGRRFQIRGWPLEKKVTWNVCLSTYASVYIHTWVCILTHMVVQIKRNYVPVSIEIEICWIFFPQRLQRIRVLKFWYFTQALDGNNDENIDQIMINVNDFYNRSWESSNYMHFCIPGNWAYLDRYS